MPQNTSNSREPWYSPRRLSFRVVATGIVALSVVSVMLMLTARQFINEISDGYEKESARTLLMRIEGALEEMSRHASLGAMTVAGLPQVQQAMANGDRQALADMFVTQWPSLKQQGIGQFQFHLPDSTSFFRVHKPEKYGDDLSSFRASVVQANRTRQAVIGLEKGVAGLGVRAVMPVTYQGRHVGTVEFGVAINADSFAALLDDEHLGMSVYLYDGGRRTRIMTTGYESPLTDEQYQQAQHDVVDAYAVMQGKPHHLLLSPLKDFSGAPVAVVEIAQNRSAIAALIASGNQRMLVLALAMIVLASLAFSLLVRHSMKPLRLLVQSMVDLANGSGSVSRRLHVDGVVEVERVTAAFNAFTANLGSTVSELVRSVSDMTAQVSVMSAESERAHRGMRRQQDEIDQIATAMTEMVSTVHSVAENTSLAADSAHHADEQAGQGVALVETNILGIQSLSETVGHTAEVVQEVVSATERIAQVLEVIRTIAEQTNLLALNAAIEAARAGEQGRGFAVVADEVRLLAQRTRSSTNEIEDMIGGLQSSVSQTVSQMERSREQAGQNVAQAQETGTALAVIKQAVDRISDMNNQIAAASEEQSSVSDEINRNILNIRDISSSTAQVSEHSASIAARLAKDTEAVMTVLQRFNTDNDELVLAQARSAHLAWKARLRAYLGSSMGADAMSRDEATNYHNCKLGKWYYGEGGQRMQHLPVMKELEAPHRAMHEAIGELMTAKENGDLATAEALLGKVEELSGRVAASLEDLQNSVAQAVDHKH